MLLKTNFSVFISNLQLPYSSPEKQVMFNNNFINKITFYEKLDGMYITGTVEINDKEGFFETIKLTGVETFILTIDQKIYNERDNFTEYFKTIEFDILDIEILDMKLKNNVYKFILIEKGAEKFYGVNYNKTFLNKKISEIMTDVAVNQLKLTEYEIEPTYDVISNYTIPYWKTALTIKNLRGKARRLTSPHEGGFLFYSTWGDSTRKTPIKRFISFAKLIEQKVKDQDKINWMDTYLFKDFSSNQYFINTIKESRYTSYCRRETFMDGIGGKHYFGLDYNTDKNIIEKKQKHSEYFIKSKVMGSESYLNTSDDSINDDVDFYGGPNFILDAKQDSSFRTLLEHYTQREIVVEGALFRYAGQNILIENKSDKNDNPEANILETGQWMIKQVINNFEDGIFIQKLIVIKDSFMKSIGLTTNTRITK